MKKRLVIIIICLSCMIHISTAQSAGDYRSKQTGAWELASSWETYNGTMWVNAGGTPSSSSGMISILNGHIITSSNNLSVDQFVINGGGTLTITASTLTINNGTGTDLDCSGTINGTGDISCTAGSTFNWTAGTIGGSGTLTINAGAGFIMNGGYLNFMDTKTINNYGTCTWNTGIFQYLSGSPVINNYGIFNIYTDGDVTGSSTGAFNNKSTGTINKTGSPAEETSFNGINSFTNAGTINVNSGKIRFNINAINTGAINLVSNANMNFTAGTCGFNTGTVLSGAGNINFDGATAAINAAFVSVNNINISSGTVMLTPSITFNTDGALNLSGGTLNGAGNINFNAGAAFNWTGGWNGGSGTMNINAGAFFTMNGGYLIFADTKTINNYGTWTWNTGPFIYYNGSPVANNYGVFNIYTDDDVSTSNGSTGSFNNKSTGTINKIGSPAEETSFNGISSFTNAGTINVNSSKIRLNTNAINAGPINVAFGASMNFGAGTDSFNAGTVLAGEGNINFDGATAAINAASVSVKNINISSGTVTLTPSITFNTDAALNLSGGTLNGTGDINFNTGATVDGTGGGIGGSGAMNINAGAIFNMNGGYLYFADTKTINNYGTWTWTDGPFQYFNGSPVANNYGIFNINTDWDVNTSNGSTGSFNNKSTGIINKIGSPTEETSFNGISAFTNAGIINVNSGNLTLNVGGTHAGTYNIDFGAELRGSINMPFTGDNFNNNGGVTLTGLTFNGSAIQYLNGVGYINTLTIGNTSGVMLTEAQTIKTNITISANSKLTVYRDLIIF